MILHLIYRFRFSFRITIADIFILQTISTERERERRFEFVINLRNQDIQEFINVRQFIRAYQVCHMIMSLH